MMQQREQNDDRDRNAQQPEKYQTHGDLLSHGVLRPVFACANHALPGAVAQLPAFDGGEAGRERADKHRRGEPQR